MAKIYSPGDIVEVCLIQAGRIRNQGVGYLNDNAVILVRNGEPFINKSIEVEITKVFQTSRQYNIVLAQPIRSTNILGNQL
jgi:uncharacterized protein YacL